MSGIADPKVARRPAATLFRALLGRSITGLPALRFVPMRLAVSYAGLALTLAGLGLALRARFYPGRNWSALVELKRDHQLIRSGPYAIVRHPIYSGFMLASLGTAVVYGELHERLHSLSSSRHGATKWHGATNPAWRTPFW